MHTFVHENDNYYAVGRMEYDGAVSEHHEFIYMFKGLSFNTAVQLVSFLNGGPVGSLTLTVLEKCQS